MHVLSIATSTKLEPHVHPVQFLIHPMKDYSSKSLWSIGNLVHPVTPLSTFRYVPRKLEGTSGVIVFLTYLLVLMIF